MKCLKCGEKSFNTLEEDEGVYVCEKCGVEYELVETGKVWEEGE